MKIKKTNFVSKMEKNKRKKRNKDEEEKNKEEDEEQKKKKNRKRFSKKALRKVIRTLCEEFAKDELEGMIWEADDNLDGYVSEKEFINMYKKCISDEKEEEGKKLLYLIKFLMYDKDEKHKITVEDTLKILCARYHNNVDKVIDSIFDIETGEKDGKGKPKKKKRENITFLEYAQRMHDIALDKRDEISNAKKRFCDKLKDEAIQNVRNKKNFNN